MKKNILKTTPKAETAGQRNNSTLWKKKVFCFLPTLLILAATFSFSSCSDDKDFSKADVRKLTLGEWIQVRQGNEDVSASKAIILRFYNNGRVVYYYPSSRFEKESTYTFEDDWQYRDEHEPKGWMGHINFAMHEERGANIPDRFQMWIDKDQLVLTPDMGFVYVTNPTMDFKRTK